MVANCLLNQRRPLNRRQTVPARQPGLDLADLDCQLDLDLVGLIVP